MVLIVDVRAMEWGELVEVNGMSKIKETKSKLKV